MNNQGMSNAFTNYKDLSTQNIFATTHVAHNPAAQKSGLGLALG